MQVHSWCGSRYCLERSLRPIGLDQHFPPHWSHIRPHVQRMRPYKDCHYFGGWGRLIRRRHAASETGRDQPRHERHYLVRNYQADDLTGCMIA